MATSLNLRGNRVVVAGFDSTAIALIKYLIKKGAQVALVDPRQNEAIDPLLTDSELDLEKFRIELGEIGAKTFENTACVILTPFALRNISFKCWEYAKMANVPVLSEIEFVAQSIDDSGVVAIASTNGKAVTAHLLKNMLEFSGKSVFANIDQPAANLLNLAKAPDQVILAVDLLQMEYLTTFKPGFLILHNLHEDYFDRYASADAYFSVARQIYKNVDEKTQLVLNVSDVLAPQLVNGITAQVTKFASSVSEDASIAAWYDKTNIYIRQGETVHTLAHANFRLRGPHNRENFIAAALVALKMGINVSALNKVIQEVRTLDGRLEFVKRSNSVAFYDDSFSCNVAAISRTLNAFYEPVILISGGKDRNLDFASLAPHIRQRVKNLILVGESKEKLNRMIGDFTETFLVGTVEEAVLMAYQKSRSGDVILFSAGCDYSDVFKSKRERSDYYKKLIQQITVPKKQNVIL